MPFMHSATGQWRIVLPLTLTFVVAAMLLFDQTSGIGIRAFKRRQKVNGVSCVQFQGNGAVISETAFGLQGCPCNLKGQRCFGNLRCNSNLICDCPPAFINSSLGCGPSPNKISLTLPNGAVGFPSCRPIAFQSLVGTSVNFSGSKPEVCKTTVVKSSTPPTDVPAYFDPKSYIFVDGQNGTITIGASIPLGPGVSTNTNICRLGGAGNPTGISEPIVQTYNITCTDSNGFVSNPVLLNVTFPSCDVIANAGPARCLQS